MRAHRRLQLLEQVRPGGEVADRLVLALPLVLAVAARGAERGGRETAWISLTALRVDREAERSRWDARLSHEPLELITPLDLPASSTQPAWLMPESKVRSNSACVAAARAQSQGMGVSWTQGRDRSAL